jgi:hypothetical protein
MALFLDQGGDSGTAFLNLYTISSSDGGLGDTAVVGDPTVLQVTYARTKASATAVRLDTLVNGVSSIPPIVITALNGGTDPYTGANVTGNGVTYVDSSSGFDIIRTVYDIGQCNGAGIALFDISGNPISAPNAVILYHELSHAYHGVIHQFPFPQSACPGNTTDEPAAEIDENVLRSQLNLCLRDVCNHGLQCGPGDDCGGSTGPDGSTGPEIICFIVTATTGSSASEEIVVMRQLRDRVAAVSGLGAQLIDAIYGEYFQFSPAIAADLQQDATAREAVLQIVVRPLFAWYTLAGALGLERDAAAVKRAVRDVGKACPRYLASTIAALLETIRAGEPLPAGAPRMLLDFAPRIREAAQFRFASWAILDPLVRVWTSTSRQLDVTDEVAQWLATAPVQALRPPRDAAALDREFGGLAKFLDFDPAARQQLGARLLEAWPDAAEALERHGLIQQRGARDE